MAEKKEEKKVSRYASSKWDPINSTYSHLIYFHDQNHPIAGYSARVGYSEKNDKTALLINVIIRLMNSGYFPGYGIKNTEMLEFFQNVHPEAKHIVTLHKKYPVWNPSYFDNKRLVSTVESIYALIEKQTPIVKIYNRLYIRERTRSTDPFDMTPRFSSVQYLNTYCHELIEKGQEKGAVEAFYHKYLEMNFKKNKQNI